MTTGPAACCDVWELARRAGSVEGEIAVGDASRLAELLADTDAALHYRMNGLIDPRGRPAARLEVRGMVRLRCDRCGAPVQVSVDELAQFFFVTDEEELGTLPIDESPEEPMLGSRRFDVAALVEEQAILALPLSPRHDHCAAAAPAEPETAADGETHRPFEALAALKKQRR